MNEKTKAQIRRRAGFQCEYCHLQEALSGLRFHIEHVIAKQHGGKDVRPNLAMACPFCNQRKGTNLAGIDPASKRMVRLFNPRTDVWREHFKMSGILIVGKTSVGRATVAVLAMNNTVQVRTRRAILES